MDDAKEENISALSNELSTLLVEAALPHVLTIDNRSQAMTSLCLHSVFLSRKAELDQFMSRLGPLIKLVQQHPDQAEPIFVAGYSKAFQLKTSFLWLTLKMFTACTKNSSTITSVQNVSNILLIHARKHVCKENMCFCFE